jgi:serine phosphatase RsbU (regulator of sigma subunit)/pSer/pThr/pTyr-binding forkhead associated (FHA) protein
MAILIILEGPESGRQFALDPGVHLVGRGPHADIFLASKAVSREHARIEGKGGAYFIEDLGGVNGTYLNGQRLAGRAPLTGRDRLAIGPFRFALIEEANLVIREQVTADSENQNLYAQNAGHQLQTVLEITQDLGRTVELDALLNQLLASLLKLFPMADRGLVLLCTGDQLVLKAQRSRLPEDASPYLYSRTIVNQVLQEGIGIRSDDVHADQRFGESETVTYLDARSLLCVPLIGHAGRRLGVIQLDGAHTAATFEGQDLRLLTTLGLQVGVVLENLELHAERLREERLRQELALAREIQAGFLPTNFPLPATVGFELYACVHPAREVSGDLYDFFALPDGRWAFYLGDVSGKGIGAALFMVAVRSLCRHLVGDGKGPGQTLYKLDAALAVDNPQAMFVTVVHGIYDPRTGSGLLAAAGHPPPLLRGPSGKVQTLSIHTGPVLGFADAARGLQETPFLLAPGETLILYSDGYTEAFSPDGTTMFGLGRLMSALEGARAELPLATCAEQVRKDVDSFTGAAELHDDLTLLLLRRCQS